MSDNAYTKAKKTLIAVHGDGLDDEIDTAYTGDIKQLIQRTFSDIVQHDKIELNKYVITQEQTSNFYFKNHCYIAYVKPFSAIDQGPSH